MEIVVFNEGNEVFKGPVSQFLADNDSDEWLAEECAKLEHVNQMSSANSPAIG